jgi:hypothetical protein
MDGKRTIRQLEGAPLSGWIADTRICNTFGSMICSASGTSAACGTFFRGERTRSSASNGVAAPIMGMFGMKKTIRTMAACACALMLAAPAFAQDRAARLGPVWSVGMIEVQPGQGQAYLRWLNDVWRSNQEFAKQQGWLLDYHILSNTDPRDGEPDLYLITKYSDEPTAAEIERRDAIMLRRMQTTPQGAAEQSAARSTMRRQMGSMTLREMLPPR